MWMLLMINLPALVYAFPYAISWSEGWDFFSNKLAAFWLQVQVDSSPSFVWQWQDGELSCHQCDGSLGASWPSSGCGPLPQPSLEQRLHVHYTSYFTPSEARRWWFAATPQPCPGWHWHHEPGWGPGPSLGLAAILRPTGQGPYTSPGSHISEGRWWCDLTLWFFFFLRVFLCQLLPEKVSLHPGRLWIVHNFSAPDSNHVFFQSTSWKSNNVRPSKWAFGALEQKSLSAESQHLGLLCTKFPTYTSPLCERMRTTGA